MQKEKTKKKEQVNYLREFHSFMKSGRLHKVCKVAGIAK